MPRTLSTPARRAIFAQETGEVFLLLLTITHQQLPTPIRVVNNSEDVTSNGILYQRFPFELALPAENDEAPPSVTLRIANADRQIVQAVRSLAGDAMGVELAVVLASSPNTIEAGPYRFTLRDVSYDASVVEGVLRTEDVLNEPYPSATFTPAHFPGMF
ncbi:MAG: DUF1833 family protein [Phycisphaerales bacterium]